MAVRTYLAAMTASAFNQIAAEMGRERQMFDAEHPIADVIVAQARSCKRCLKRTTCFLTAIRQHYVP